MEDPYGNPKEILDFSSNMPVEFMVNLATHHNNNDQIVMMP